MIFIQQFFVRFLTSTTDLLLMMLVLSGVFVYAGILDKPIVEILFIVFIFRRSMLYMVSCQNSFVEYLAICGSVHKINELYKELDSFKNNTSTGAVKPMLPQPINVNNLSFGYTDGHEFLQNINLNIRPGDKIALVGASGLGKSTLAMLLAGSLQPTKGEILLGYTNYNDLDIALFRSNIGYVSQENVIFNDTVINNVSLWEADPDIEKIKESLDMVSANDFIETLPEKYETTLGNDGNVISGGQRQRIAIARELYKDSYILILDEATSSLDSQAELDILPK